MAPNPLQRTTDRSTATRLRKAVALAAAPALLLLSAAGACLAADAPPAPADDPVVLTLATVGDSRAERGAAELNGQAVDGQDARWLQNTPVLVRLLDAIEEQHPNLLVFNGDLIMGYTPDAREMDREYAFWRGVMARLIVHGTYVLPVPGNHEVQRADPGRKGKIARPENEALWRDNMGDLVIDQARFARATGQAAQAFDPASTPAVGGADGIRTDQSRLTYSLDVQGVHIAVINSDAVGRDAHAPVAWLAADLAAAQARGLHRMFVFGHKPAFTYHVQGADKFAGFDADPPNQQAFWDLVERYHATYFCGHQHIFHMSQPRLAGGGSAWQVIVGSGGSPFELEQPDGNPEDRMYAWAQVQVHRSGRAQVTIWGFLDPQGPVARYETVDLP